MIHGEPFSVEQQNYLMGFVAGCDAARGMSALPTLAATLAAVSGQSAPSSARQEDIAPGVDPMLIAAQDRFVAAGQKLCPEEQAKRDKNPLDMWDDLATAAEQGAFPKGADVLRFKYHGLFYVAPAQDAFMARLRFAGGIVKSYQMRAVADIAERWAGGYADVTTRANLQLRDIGPRDTLSVLTALQDAGIVIKGSGADNVRNITAPATAGIDPQELFDTRPLASELHHTILHHRELHGLPRKFNIAFDGGGTTGALEETNDIGFSAVRVGKGQSIPPGVYFRVLLGGITGHLDFARDTGLALSPHECLPVAIAMLKVFIQHGDRTDRKKARLKYLLDRWGMERLLDEMQKQLRFPLRRVPLAECERRGPLEPNAHIGIHPQRQADRSYVGVVLPVGRLTVAQLRGLAEIAERFGSGTIRLTVWQNLLISDLANTDIPHVRRRLEQLGLDWRATNLRSALVACTGNAGCRFAAADTKRHALEVVQHLESRLSLDQPINIHLTGCPHSCAQHYIGDIGLLATKIADGDEMVEGYHLFVGGGFGAQQAIGREIRKNIPASQLGAVLEPLLLNYLDSRHANESFGDFTRRCSIEQLQSMLQEQLQMAVT
jgi:ferredoxin-nitrite reductase